MSTNPITDNAAPAKIMDFPEGTMDGFAIRCYSDDCDRGQYAGIICDICDSVEDVADAIVEELKERVEHDAGTPLTAETWQRVRARIVKDACPPVWEFEPRFFDELIETNAPESIKVNQVRLSRRLVARMRNGK